MFLSAHTDKSIRGTYIELCASLYWAKLSPIGIHGTLTPRRCMHIFAINFASATATATPATTATATPTPAPTRFFQENKGTLKLTYWITSSNRGAFNFFSGFQEDVEFGHTVDFLVADFVADFTYGDAFEFNSISSGSFGYDNVSLEFSI